MQGQMLESSGNLGHWEMCAAEHFQPSSCAAKGRVPRGESKVVVTRGTLLLRSGHMKYQRKRAAQ